MTSPPSDFAAVRFSSLDLPEDVRLSTWKDVLGRTAFTADMDPLSDGQFHVEATMRALPGLRMVSGVIANLHVTRTRAHEALDGGDDLIFTMNTGGVRIITQRGREQTLGAGDACLMAHAEPGTVVFPSQSRFFGLRLPRKTFAPLIKNVDDAVMCPVPRDTDALRLLAHYVAGLDDGHQFAAPELRHLVTTHVHDLVALAIGASGDVAAQAKDRGVQAARLVAIKADIVANLGHRNLAVDMVAKRQNLTPRSLQRLFESEGTTFSEYVLHQRLLRAQRLLIDPRLFDWTVSAVAFEAGFGDLSYFNRTFRRFHGATPSDMRAAARRGNPWAEIVEHVSMRKSEPDEDRGRNEQ